MHVFPFLQSLADGVAHLDRPVQPFEALPEVLRSRKWPFACKALKRAGILPTALPRAERMPKGSAPSRVSMLFVK